MNSLDEWKLFTALSDSRPLVSRLGRRRVQAVGDGVQVIGEQAGVDVQGHGSRRVAEHLLNGFHVR